MFLESAEQEVDGSDGTDETCGDNNSNQTTYNMPGNLSFIIKIAILFGGWWIYLLNHLFIIYIW